MDIEALKIINQLYMTREEVLNLMELSEYDADILVKYMDSGQLADSVELHYVLYSRKQVKELIQEQMEH